MSEEMNLDSEPDTLHDQGRRRLIPTLVPWLVVLGVAFGGVLMGRNWGLSLSISVLISTVLVGLVLLCLERVMAVRKDWQTFGPDLREDLAHLLFGFGLGSFGGTALAEWAGPYFSAPLWPRNLPFVAQMILALIVAEFGVYWQHRAMHRIPSLWRLHMLHHHSREMTFFKTTRIHALDIGSATFLTVFPLLVLQATEGVVVSTIAFGNVIAQVQHANVRFASPRWLSGLIGTPANHWLHHSLDLVEGNSNFGMNIMVWDRVFGTYIVPVAAHHQVLGVEQDSVPRGAVAQVMLPIAIIRNWISARRVT